MSALATLKHFFTGTENSPAAPEALAARLATVDASMKTRKDAATAEAERLAALRTRVAAAEAARPALLVQHRLADDTQAQVVLDANAAEAEELHQAIRDAEATVAELRRQFDGLASERATIVRAQHVVSLLEISRLEDAKAIQLDRAGEMFGQLLKEWIALDGQRVAAERLLAPKFSEVNIGSRLKLALSHHLLTPIRLALPFFPTNIDLDLTHGHLHHDFCDVTPTAREAGPDEE